MYRTSPDRLRPFARAAALLVLAVLALGLPQLLQLCRHGGEPVRIGFVGGAACCDHDHGGAEAVHFEVAQAVAAARDHGVPTLGEAPDDCEHTSLGIDLQRLPTNELPARLAAEPALGGLHLATAPTPAVALATRQPPATGPPRPERRSAQLVCTILRQ